MSDGLTTVPLAARGMSACVECGWSCPAGSEQLRNGKLSGPYCDSCAASYVRRLWGAENAEQFRAALEDLLA